MNAAMFFCWSGICWLAGALTALVAVKWGVITSKEDER